MISCQEVSAIFVTLADLASEGLVKQSVDKVLAFLSSEGGLAPDASPVDVLRSEARGNSFIASQGTLFEQTMMTEDLAGDRVFGFFQLPFCMSWGFSLHLTQVLFKYSNRTWHGGKLALSNVEARR